MHEYPDSRGRRERARESGRLCTSSTVQIFEGPLAQRQQLSPHSVSPSSPNLHHTALWLCPFLHGEQVSTNAFIGAYLDRLLEQKHLDVDERLSGLSTSAGDDISEDANQHQSKGAKRGEVGLAFEDFVHIYWVFSASASRAEKEEGGDFYAQECIFARFKMKFGSLTMVGRIVRGACRPSSTYC